MLFPKYHAKITLQKKKKLLCMINFKLLVVQQLLFITKIVKKKKICVV